MYIVSTPLHGDNPLVFPTREAALESYNNFKTHLIDSEDVKIFKAIPFDPELERDWS